jgi:hypothetical protein
MPCRFENRGCQKLWGSDMSGTAQPALSIRTNK